jgi:hypothetical protein
MLPSFVSNGYLIDVYGRKPPDTSLSANVLTKSGISLIANVLTKPGTSLSANVPTKPGLPMSANYTYKIVIFFKTPMSLQGSPYYDDPLRTLLELGNDANVSLELAKHLSPSGVSHQTRFNGQFLGKNKNKSFELTGRISTDFLAPPQLFGKWRFCVRFHGGLYEVISMIRCAQTDEQKALPLHLEQWGLNKPKVNVTELMLKKINGTKKTKKVFGTEDASWVDHMFANASTPDDIPSPNVNKELMQKSIKTMLNRTDATNQLERPLPCMLCTVCTDRIKAGATPIPGCSQMTFCLVDMSGLFDIDNLIIVCCQIVQSCVSGEAGVIYKGKRINMCANCRAKSDKMSKCPCKAAAYCGKTCVSSRFLLLFFFYIYFHFIHMQLSHLQQRAHWKAFHKKTCLLK